MLAANSAGRPSQQPSPIQSNSSVVPESNGTTANFHVGDRVLVGGVKPGVIAFLGSTQFAKGVWAGIILDTFEGKNNGSVAGVQYFECESNRGLFSKPEKLKLESKTQNPADKHSERPSRNFKVGDQVLVDGVKSGVIGFIGQTQFARGVWVGVILDTAEGKNNGSVGGVQYFDCAPNHGLFTKLQKLAHIEPKSSPVHHRPPVGANIPPAQQAQAQISRGSSLEGSSRASSSQPTDAAQLKALRDKLKIGDHVLVGGMKEGILRFLGTTEFAKGVWAGVELPEPLGKNDGAVSGKR
jgi:dynactin complex subunit